MVHLIDNTEVAFRPGGLGFTQSLMERTETNDKIYGYVRWELWGERIRPYVSSYERTRIANSTPPLLGTPSTTAHLFFR